MLTSDALRRPGSCDHLVQARTEGARDLMESVQENQEVYSFLRSAAARFGAATAFRLSCLPGADFVLGESTSP